MHTRGFRVLSGGLLLLAVSLLAEGAQAQSYQIGPLRTGGSIRLTSQAYAARGIDGRRAPLVGEAAGSVTFNLWGLRSGLNLHYSTDQSRLRQSMTRLAFGTSWGWGTFALGDVSPSFSAYSLSGATVRGGYAELHPGAFQFSFAGGRAQRAVTPSARSALLESPYERWLWATRLGAGQPERSHVHLIATLGRDTPEAGADTLGAPRAVENLTVTPAFGLVLLQKRLSLFGEVTASAFTRDTRSEALDLESAGIPESATDLFQPRSGTRVDFAAAARFRLDLEAFGLHVDYRRIMPTFESLGLGQIRQDEERVRLRPRFNLLERRLSVAFDLAQTRNNLLGQRTASLRRRQAGATVQVRPSPFVILTGAYQRLTNTNDPVSSDPVYAPLAQRQVSQTFMLAPTLILRAGATTHTFSASGVLQTFGDESPRAGTGGPSADFTNLNGSLTYALAFPSGLSLGLSGNALRSDAATLTTESFGVQASAGAAFLERTLSLTLSAGLAQSSSTAELFGTSTSSRQLLGTLGAAYRVTSSDAVRLTVRGLSNASTGGQATSFDEVQAQLRYEHRF